MQLDSAHYMEAYRQLAEFWQTLSRLFLLEPVASFIRYPFRERCQGWFTGIKNCYNTSHLNSSGVEDEILTIQADIKLKFRAHGYFWNLLTEVKYPNMRKGVTSLIALFSSTYLCESAFSRRMIIKPKYRSTTTDQHLEVCLRLAVSSGSPDYASLSGSI